MANVKVISLKKELEEEQRSSNDTKKLSDAEAEKTAQKMITILRSDDEYSALHELNKLNMSEQVAHYFFAHTNRLKLLRGTISHPSRTIEACAIFRKFTDFPFFARGLLKRKRLLCDLRMFSTVGLGILQSSSDEQSRTDCMEPAYNVVCIICNAIIRNGNVKSDHERLASLGFVQHFMDVLFACTQFDFDQLHGFYIQFFGYLELMGRSVGFKSSRDIFLDNAETIAAASADFLRRTEEMPEFATASEMLSGVFSMFFFQIHEIVGLFVRNPDFLSMASVVMRVREKMGDKLPERPSTDFIAIHQFCSAPSCDKNSDTAKLRTCSRCRTVMYCSHECQKSNWNVHKKICKLTQKSTQSGKKKSSNV